MVNILFLVPWIINNPQVSCQRKIPLITSSDNTLREAKQNACIDMLVSSKLDTSDIDDKGDIVGSSRRQFFQDDDLNNLQETIHLAFPRTSSTTSAENNDRLNFNEILGDLTIDDEKEENEKSCQAKKSEVSLSNGDEEDEDEEEKEEMARRGLTKSPELEKEGTPADEKKEEFEPISLLYPCMCGATMTTESLYTFIHDYGVGIEGLKKNFLNDFELERILKDLQDLKNELATSEFEGVDSIPDEIGRSFSFPVETSTRKETETEASGNQTGQEATKVGQKTSTGKHVDLTKKTGPDPTKAARAQSSFHCFPGIEELEESEYGLEVHLMPCMSTDENRKKTVLEWLACSARKKHRRESADKPEVLRIKLRDGSMATVSRETVPKLTTCEWV